MTVALFASVQKQKEAQSKWNLIGILLCSIVILLLFSCESVVLTNGRNSNSVKGEKERKKTAGWGWWGVGAPALKTAGNKKVHLQRWLLYCQDWLPVNSIALAIHQQHSYSSNCNSPFTAPGIYRYPVVCCCCALFLAKAHHLQQQSHWFAEI